MIEYKTNLVNVLKDFDKLDFEMKAALKQGLNLGMMRFMGHIQLQQMTGRKSPGFGLNVRTGHLRGSWYTKIINDSGNEYGVILSTRSKYAAIHQFGGIVKAKNKPFLHFKIGKGWVRTKSVTIPKRLYIYEAFKQEGMTTLRRAMFQSIGKLSRIRATSAGLPPT